MHIPTEQFSLALDEQLSREDMEAMRQHVGSCASCRREWETWQDIAVRFEHAPMAGPRPGFVHRVEERLTRRSSLQRGVLGGTVLLTGSVTLWSLVALVGLMLVFTWLTLDPAAAGTLVTMAVRVAQTAAPITGAIDVLLDNVQPAALQLLLLLVSAALLLAASTWGHVVLRYRRASAETGQS